MKIYNTLTEKKEELGAPLDDKELALFVCGPTVYDYAHLGHSRVAIVFDVAKRYLESRGMRIRYIQNITDVDDKIVDRAKNENQPAKSIARAYEKAYVEDMRALNVTAVDAYPRASEHIPEIITQISGLIKKGCAYATSSGVYFEVRKFKNYGRLSKQNLDELRPNYRIEPDIEKRDPLDFALWKFKKEEHEPSWTSPWGEGRPGWHIEDTAITEKYFGPQYDWHGGGMDLKFPHHEAEIAQQESLSGKSPLVRIWTHVGFVLASGEKMSKSLKNFVTVRDFLKDYPAATLRLLILGHQHRSPLNYSAELAATAYKNLNSLSQALAKLNRADSPSPAGIKIDDYERRFNEKMDDDLNTPEALAVLFSFTHNMNKVIWNLNKKEAHALKKWMEEKLRILGIQPITPRIPLMVRFLSWRRELYRKHQQFIKSDLLRKKVERVGYVIEDTPKGPFIWPITHGTTQSQTSTAKY